MTEPMLHSRLAQRIAQSGARKEEVLAIIRDSSGGVLPEGWDGKPVTLMLKSSVEELTNTASAMPSKHSNFRFGKGSENELVGVHPGLVAVTRLALDMSAQDFVVYEGVRTLKAQVNNVHAGVSKTMHSKHLIQADGFSHAVDLVPYMNGRPTWDWDGCFRIALAMCDAALTQGVAHKLTWGGAWDRRLSDFATLGGSLKIADIKAAVEAYKTRHPGPDFLDGPHFEWEV
jgi:peptidoglycan L-alanyl-D-glutamate endopeptidase CwlK